MLETKKNEYSFLLIFFILLGLLTGLYLVYERNQVEQAQNHIENIMDYDAVMRSAAYEKGSKEETLKAVRDAGITAMAIYDRTLEKANDNGEIRVIRSEDAKNIHFYGSTVKNGATYIMPVQGKEMYFKEIWEDLNHRLGQSKVVFKNTAEGPALELMQPYTSLLDMKLSVSRQQAIEVSKLGFNVILRPSNFKDVTKDDIDFFFKRMQGIPNITGIVFVGKEVLGYPDQQDLTFKYTKEMHIPIVGIEAVNQLQYDPQMGFDKMVADSKYSVGRLYTVTKDELKKLSPAEVSQWFYISDLERNIRFNLYPIYEEGVGNKTSLGTSLGYIKDVNDKLLERGFEFGRASVYPAYNPSVIPFMVTMFGAIALFTFVVNLFIPLRKRNQYSIFASLCFISLILYALTSGRLLSQIWALSSAILAPTGAIVLIMDCWKQRVVPQRINKLSAVGQAIVYTLGAALIAAIGAMYIAGMLGNTRFFMEFALFRGVKLTFVMPIILVVIAYLQRFPLWQGRTINSVGETKAFLKEFMMKEIKAYTVLVLGLLAVVVYIFIGRSGHTAGVPVPGIEMVLRRFLENTLYARPREKEFLIGHPALMIASFVFLRRWPMIIHFIFTVGGVIGVGSMVETFCHLRTPVLMSIHRGLDGLWLGILIGIIGIIILSFLTYISNWYQKREVGNE